MFFFSLQDLLVTGQVFFFSLSNRTLELIEKMATTASTIKHKTNNEVTYTHPNVHQTPVQSRQSCGRMQIATVQPYVWHHGNV